MVDVTLFSVWAESVERLVHTWHRQGAHVHDLGLTTLEESGSVCARQHSDFSRQWTKIARTTSVDTNALLDDSLAHQFLGEASHRFLDGLFLTVELARCSCCATQFSDRLVCCCVGGGVAICLQCNRNRSRQLRRCCLFDCCEHLVGVIENWCVLERRDWTLCCDHAGDQLALQCDRLFDPTL